VLDLSTVVAGPAATMILADLGADVIKVERMDGGDDSRGMGPLRNAWGSYFVPLNRGKRSIALDITRPQGREVVLRLARSCDVLVENYRGGRLQALGLGEDALRVANPGLIYASLTGYGPCGPDFSKPAYDALIQGRTGIVSVTGAAGAATRAGVSIIDLGAGMWLAMGILAALHERQKSGRGQRVDTSLFQTGVMLMLYHLAYYQFTGVTPGPQGSGHPAFAPYGAFDTSDGRIMIGISNDRQFKRLAAAMGHAEWADDPRFATNVLRVENRADLDGRLQDVFREKPRAHWTALLEAAEVPVSPIQDTAELLHDPQLAAIGQLASVLLPGAESVRVPRLPFDLTETPLETGKTVPALGEHGRAILAEAGYAPAEIEELKTAGVCRLP
jgi:crotonobetainyl-CoA:carnitine CoA-transferase CaiB-like acyl-CoA transferase